MSKLLPKHTALADVIMKAMVVVVFSFLQEIFKKIFSVSVICQCKY